MTRTGFVFYESYLKIMCSIGAEECQKLLKQMGEYALYGAEPEAFSSDLTEGLWLCFFPSLQKGRVNAENRSKRDEKQPSPAEKSETASAQKRDKRAEKAPEKQPPKPTENAPKDPTAEQNKAPETDLPFARNSTAKREKRLTEYDFREPETKEGEQSTPLNEYAFADLTCDERHIELEERKKMEDMGILVDCCMGDVDPEEVKKRFAESTFLRETFKSLSKIKRHYDKIVAGVYKDVRAANSAPDPQHDYMLHNYSPERLQAALVNFDEWEEKYNKA